MRRNGNISQTQKKRLLEKLQGNITLAKGKFTSVFKFKDAQTQWEAIAAELNQIPGAQKDWKHWRRTWQDLKKQVKSKRARSKRSATSTGGGPPEDVNWSHEEESVLGMLDLASIQANIGVFESVVGIITDNNDELRNEPTPPTSAEVQAMEFSAPTTEPRTETKMRKHIATKRLGDAIMANDRFLAVYEKETILKNKYYHEKLQLLRRDTIAKESLAAAIERMAAAKERIATALEKISENK